MPTINDGYLDFQIYDVFGVPSLSSYTLSNTPLTFIPSFDTFNELAYSNQFLLWDFNDGTYSKEITASHVFTQPGEYTVTLKLIKEDGTGVTGLINRTVDIYNVVSDYISLSTTGFTELTAGEYSPPINLYRYNSWQSSNNVGTTIGIVPFASGGQSIRYDVFNYSKQPYSQLIPTNRFVIREQVGVLNIYDDIIVDKIFTTNDSIYLRLNFETNSYEISTTQYSDSVFAGTSGEKTVYFVDDLPTNVTGFYNLLFTFDTSNFNSDSLFTRDLPILNVNSLVYPFTYVRSNVPDTLSITSNGVTGEGQYLTTFDIDNTQFKEGIVSFVIRPKSVNSYTVDYIPLSASGIDYTLSLISPVNNVISIALLNKNNEIIPGYTTPLSSIQILPAVYNDVISPYIKGKIILSNVPNASSENVKIFAVGKLQNIGIQYTDNSNYFYDLQVSGTSAPFNVYNNSNYGGVAKINENFNSESAYQSLATQPIIADSPILINDVMGQIGGNITAPVSTLGKRIFEKIANYVPNLADVDTCNVEALFSLTDLYGIESIKYVRGVPINTYPPDVVRLIDLFSIKRNYLFGTRNTWNENLDKRTNVYNTVNGINTNLQAPTYSSPVITLDVATTILDKNDQYIVAYENFTRLYSILPLDVYVIQTQTYPLSGIQESWGWNLILPPDFYQQSQTDRVITLPKFYTFYKWNNYIDGTILGNTINWGDPINTQIRLPDYEQYPTWNNPSLLSSWYDSSLSAWYEDDGYVDRNLIYTLSNGVGLLSGI
jgi:hypothetical protein